MDKPCVLVVDDDEAFREALFDALTDQGYPTECVGNGAEALTWLHGHSLPCVILLDLMMPVMNGWDFLAAQRKDAAIAEVPVVVLSASHVNNDAVAKRLAKPVDLKELISTISQYC